ncbi:hypothetical protein P5P86_03220 [Nocardioides sp. BP30]|uniref:hypothetical protein n=1 Tax=Nocardioides sp. BP30 TaxID=3036374 RepID=UPI0024689C05|nr:hypothetical protein [Nocardioides sp. BP30]WGL52839.1 hypothetical protein P5P86_03220 [Nocardioides sp. BP30]
MLRSALSTSTAVAATAAVMVATATAVPSSARAATHPHGGGSGSVHPTSSAPLARMTDPRGDVVTKSGSFDDIDGSIDGFKPGKGTVVPTTTADDAIDLHQVTYRILRIDGRPTLKITYRANGPFHNTRERTHIGNTTTVTYDVDDLDILVAGGRYDLEAMPHGGVPRVVGLFRNNDRHKQIACKGLHTTMNSGASIATQTVPLSCLTGLGIKRSRLRAVANHIAFSDSTTTTSTATGTSTTTDTSGPVTVATDTVVGSWRLPFTH